MTSRDKCPASGVDRSRDIFKAETIIDYDNLDYEDRLYNLVYKNNLGGHVWRPDYINCNPGFTLHNDLSVLCFFLKEDGGGRNVIISNFTRIMGH